jgi:hypothetical protein
MMLVCAFIREPRGGPFTLARKCSGSGPGFSFTLIQSYSCRLLVKCDLVMVHYATPARGILGFTACPRAMMAARGPERSVGPRAAIMAQGWAVKPRSPREGVA